MSVTFYNYWPYVGMKGATRDHLDECLVLNQFYGDLHQTFSQHGISRMTFLGGIFPSTSASRTSCSSCPRLLTDLIEKQGPIHSEITISDQAEGKFQKSITAGRNRSTSLCWTTREGQEYMYVYPCGTCTRRKHI